MTKSAASSTGTKDEAPKKGKQCFVITPIGKEASAERRRADGLYNAVLKPVLENHAYMVYAAHQVADIGSITEKIISDILHSELVVADLSGLNPNVMYELAVRHATGLPVVVIADESTVLPFDIKQERTLFYRDDFSGCMQLRRDLDAIVDSIENGRSKNDNPITRVSSKRILNPTVKVAPTEEVILERIDFLAEQISLLNRRQQVKRHSYTSLDPVLEGPHRIILELQVDPATTSMRALREIISNAMEIGPENIRLLHPIKENKIRVSIDVSDTSPTNLKASMQQIGNAFGNTDQIKLLRTSLG